MQIPHYLSRSVIKYDADGSVCVFVHIHIDPVEDAIIAMCNFHLHRLQFWRTLSPL